MAEVLSQSQIDAQGLGLGPGGIQLCAVLQQIDKHLCGPLAGELIVPAHIVFPQGRGRVAGYPQLVDLDAPAEEAVEKKYRKYDFYSPRKFTKDRIRMLNSIFENYTRVINSRLNAMLHSTCEIEVDSVEEQRYHEFSNALRESDVLALVKTDQKLMLM